MAIDIVKLFRDNNIPYWTEGKNVSVGWVNTTCVWCNDTSNHLGFNLEKNYFRCWKCGWHPMMQTLERMLKISKWSIRKMLDSKYGGYHPRVLLPEKTIQIRTKAHRLPSNTGPLLKSHKKYLINRRFDPDLIEATWGILGTGPISHLDKISFNRRIIVPIMWEGKQVSFVARDITNKHPLRYIVCPKDRELVHHKHILYGKQEEWKEKGICVEGVTDVWRLGTQAFATFGIEYTTVQVRVIASFFKEVIVMFDDEPQAQFQADKLMSELRMFGIHVRKEVIKGDPGGMDQKEAIKLVEKLLGG